MAIYVKEGAFGGGSWRQIQPGQVRVKRPWEGSWTYPNFVYAKLNGGGWRDTLYRGYPWQPASCGVASWDFSTVNFVFSGPAGGGPPIAQYEVTTTWADGSWLTPPHLTSAYHFYTTSGGPHGIPVAQDWRIRIYVRSIGDTGLVSNWISVGAQIGHTETGYNQTEDRWRDWESGHLAGWKGKDDPMWTNVPTNYIVHGMHWRNIYREQCSPPSRISPGNFDFYSAWDYSNPWFYNVVFWYDNGDGSGQHDRGDIGGNFGGQVDRNHYADVGMGGISGYGSTYPNAHMVGIVPRGFWATDGNANYMLYVQEFWLNGQEKYQVSVYYKTRDYVGNSYW